MIPTIRHQIYWNYLLALLGKLSDWSQSCVWLAGTNDLSSCRLLIRGFMSVRVQDKTENPKTWNIYRRDNPSLRLEPYCFLHCFLGCRTSEMQFSFVCGVDFDICSLSRVIFRVSLLRFCEVCRPGKRDDGFTWWKILRCQSVLFEIKRTARLLSTRHQVM